MKPTSMLKVSALQLAANQGNDLEILNLMTELPTEYAVFAQTLQRIVENFEFDKILDAIALLPSAS